MSKINFPCETAAIFKDVLFVIKPGCAAEILSETDKAIGFYLAHFPKSTPDSIRSGVLYSFDGLYLNDLDARRVAA